MSQLLTFFEMQMRYHKGEDPFDLTTEKWVRIRQSVGTASTLNDFQELSRAANVGVPFCSEYQMKNCLGCPLEKICGPGEEGKLLKVIKLIQTNLLAFLAGNTLPKDSLTSEIDGLLMELEMLKAKFRGRGE